MAVTFNKKPGLKYTTMAMYIDAHINEVVEEGKNPEVESTIFEYLYHIIYALSYKAMFFKNFEDYDTFALTSAAQLYMSMIKKLKNVGKVVRGKEVVPIKSSLNFIKSVLFPLKVNYQKDNFVDILNPEVNNQDTSILNENLRNNIQVQYRTNLEDSLRNMIQNLPKIAWSIIWNTPYKKDKLFCKKLYLSCILTFINTIALSNQKRKKIKNKKENDNLNLNLILQNYKDNCESSVLLWHLDEKFKDYVLLLTRKIKDETSKDLEENIHAFDLDENIIDFIMNSGFATNEDDDNMN